MLFLFHAFNVRHVKGMLEHSGASGGSVKSGIEALGVPAAHVAVLTPQAPTCRCT